MRVSLPDWFKKCPFHPWSLFSTLSFIHPSELILDRPHSVGMPKYILGLSHTCTCKIVASLLLLSLGTSLPPISPDFKQLILCSDAMKKSSRSCCHLYSSGSVAWARSIASSAKKTNALVREPVVSVWCLVFLLIPCSWLSCGKERPILAGIYTVKEGRLGEVLFVAWSSLRKLHWSCNGK